MTLEQWDQVMHANLRSVFNMTKLVINGMLEERWGRVINISSVNGQKGQFGQANYAAAKAGMHGFTKSLAQEVASKGGNRKHNQPRLHHDNHGRGYWR